MKSGQLIPILFSFSVVSRSNFVRKDSHIARRLNFIENQGDKGETYPGLTNNGNGGQRWQSTAHQQNQSSLHLQ